MLSVKLTLNYFLKNKWKFIIYFSVIALTYPFESIAMSKIISKLSQNLPKFTKNKELISKLFIYLCACYTIIKLAYAFLHYIEDYIFPQFYLEIRKYFYDNLLQRYEIDYKNVEIGKFLGNIIILPGVIKRTFLTLLTVFVPGILTLIVLNIYFLKQSKYLFLLAISLPLVDFVIYKALGVKCIAKAKTRDTFFNNMNETTKDKLDNLFSIYVNNNVSNEIKNYTDLEEQYLKINLKTKNCNNGLFLAININSIIFFSVTLYLLFYLVKNKQITSESAITCLIMFTYYFSYTNSITRELPYLSTYMGQLSNAETFLKNISKQTKYRDTTLTKQITRGEIIVDNISFGYNKYKPIIKNRTINIKAGLNLGIYGYSGSGKSTFVKLLLGFYKINKGSIKIDGTNLYHFNLNYLRDKISYVSQNNMLFNTSILENIKYGSKISNNKVYDFIKNNRITLFDTLPKGLDTNVGIAGNKISGGQRQMVLLIKAFIKQSSKIFILDEPTTGLDEGIKKIILDFINVFSKNKTFIIVSHDPSVKTIFDKIIYF